MHAGIAEHLAAARALVSHTRVGMTRAEQRTIRKDDRRAGPGNIEFRNGDGDVGRFDEKFDFAKAEALAGDETNFLDRLAGNEGAIGRTAIGNNDFIVAGDDLAMAGGDGWMIDLEVIFCAAAKAVNPQFQVYHLVPKHFRLNQQPCHRPLNVKALYSDFFGKCR